MLVDTETPCYVKAAEVAAHSHLWQDSMKAMKNAAIKANFVIPARDKGSRGL